MQQKMMVQDPTHEVLFVGTKQECLHFIKSRHFKQGEVKLKLYKDREPDELKIYSSEVKIHHKGI